MRPDRYDRIYKNLVKIIPDLRDIAPGEGRTSSPTKFGNMDLHLDILTKSDTEMVIALSHNYQQNGDTIADPDMQIRVYLIKGWEKAEALTYQDSFIYQEVYPTPKTVIPKLKKSMNSFLEQWLKNIINQGHSLRARKEELN